MNEFASIESSKGILKDSYPSDQAGRKETEEALKRKRNRLFMTKLGVAPEEVKDQLPQGQGG